MNEYEMMVIMSPDLDEEARVGSEGELEAAPDLDNAPDLQLALENDSQPVRDGDRPDHDEPGAWICGEQTGFRIRFRHLPGIELGLEGADRDGFAVSVDL